MSEDKESKTEKITKESKEMRETPDDSIKMQKENIVKIEKLIQ